MIRGLDLFRERFREHEASLVLIGGAACHEWLARESLHFRATKDLDIVLLLEAVEPSFVATFRQFVDDGGYEDRKRTESILSLYRFEKPQQQDFPVMLEVFSRTPAPQQNILELSRCKCVPLFPSESSPPPMHEASRKAAPRSRSMSSRAAPPAERTLRGA